MKHFSDNPELDAAMWAGDVGLLSELAPCRCCCDEHTVEDCEARQWFGCRGQGTLTRQEEEAWAAHYREHHGLSWEQFYGYEPLGVS